MALPAHDGRTRVVEVDDSELLVVCGKDTKTPGLNDPVTRPMPVVSPDSCPSSTSPLPPNTPACHVARPSKPGPPTMIPGLMPGEKACTGPPSRERSDRGR